MLRIPEDSGPLALRVRRAEEWASKNTRIPAEFLRGEKKPIIAYGAGGLPAALTLYWAEIILLNHTPLILSADAATYHLLPYRENLKIILLTTSSRDNSAYRLMETARLVGHRLLAVSPRPPEQLERLFEPHIHVELEEGIPGALGESMLALKAAYMLAGRRRGRINRLEEEIGSLAAVMREVEERYGEAAGEMAGMAGGELTVAYTPIMLGPALRIAEIMGGASHAPRLAEASALASQAEIKGSVGLLYTSVEEAAARNLRTRILKEGLRMIEVGFNTDPLTAQIYGLMVAEMIGERLVGEGEGEEGQDTGV